MANVFGIWHLAFSIVSIVSVSRPSGVVVQLVRTPACHAGGREFESRRPRHLLESSMPITHTTRSLSTEAARAGRRWYITDADGQVLGRLAARIATVLRGKHTPAFSPHVDAGDFVI